MELRLPLEMSPGREAACRAVYSKFFASKRKKPFMLSIDRNILSSLIKFCENGSLKNKEESQIVGIIMAWARMNDIPITAGQSVQERSTQTGSQEEGLSELQKFFEIIEKYPGQMWLDGHRFYSTRKGLP